MNTFSLELGQVGRKMRDLLGNVGFVYCVRAEFIQRFGQVILQIKVGLCPGLQAGKGNTI